MHPHRAVAAAPPDHDLAHLADLKANIHTQTHINLSCLFMEKKKKIYFGKMQRKPSEGKNAQSANATSSFLPKN